MQITDISAFALIAMGFVALLCLVGPLLVQVWWARGRRWLWVSFAFGAVTFAASQLLTRIPLITVILPVLPEWQAMLRNALLSAFVLSFSAALFEETGRLVVMSTFMKRHRRTHANGVSFGLGHGGLEAFVLVGLSMVSVLVLGILAKMGQWDALTAAMGPEAARALQAQLQSITVFAALAGGLERVSAIALHVGLSVLVLLGVTRERPLRAWLLAMLVHGSVNFIAVVALNVWHWPALAVEGILLLVAVAAIWWVIRAQSLFPAEAQAADAVVTRPRRS